MTIKDLIEYNLIYDIFIWERMSMVNDGSLNRYGYGRDCKVGFCKLNTKFMLAICKDESFSKNKFDIHICDIYTSLKKVEL